MKLFLVCTVFLVLSSSLLAQTAKIMLVTGGHSYDTLQFLRMFDSLENISFEHFNQPLANQALVNGTAEGFDVLVFYDMWRKITEPEKEAFLKLTRQGKPFLFLHHALVSYQEWTEFENLLGGRYVENAGQPKARQSTYEHDVWVDIEIADNHHPATLGMNNFRIFDEVYGNFRVLPQVKPLLKTNHPLSTPVIGWENRYNSSSIIYLQPGHDKNAFESENYRRLVTQAIRYLAGKK